jgi:SAM-dependent methyltransferase
MAYFRWRRALEFASLDHPMIGELFLRRRFSEPKLIPPSGWDEQYQQGVYDRLLRDDQKHHLRLLGSLIGDGRADLSVLEIGCGEGAFVEVLRGQKVRAYVGVDFSPVVIEKARARFSREIAEGWVRFEVGDGRAYSEPARFDAIVFPECIEYLGDVEALLNHYEPMLTPGGVIGVTQWLGIRPLRLWRKLRRIRTVLNEAVVSAAWGGAWVVTTLAPKAKAN